MSVPAIGAQGEMLVAAGASATGPTGYTFDNTVERYEIISEGIQAFTPTVERDGFRGSRSLPQYNIKRGATAVAGSITLAPSPKDLDAWLPRIMRKAAVDDTFGLGDLTGADVKFGIMIQRVTDVFTYDNCEVSRATFRGSPGQLLTLTLDIIGYDEATENTTNSGGGTDEGDPWPGSPPSWGTGLEYQPYIYHEGALVLTSVAAANDPLEVEIVIDNMLQPRFTMSRVATELSASDQIIVLSLTFPYDADHQPMYRQSENVTPAGGTVTFTNGSDSGLSTLFTFAHLQGGDATPVLNTKGELTWSVPLRARSTRTGAVINRDELIITNDATPT